MTRIHLLGTGGYHPTEDRHTLCLMIPEDGLVLDAGTGFFRVRELLRTSSLDILLSHAHLDHSCGLTYLLDVLWNRGVEKVTVHSAQEHLEAVESSLFRSPMFPLAFDHGCHAIEGPFSIGTWMVRSRRQRHPGGSLGFRLDGPTGSIAYITDTTAEPDDDEAVAFLREVDLLFHECYFPDELEMLARSSGHSTASGVGKIARAAQVGRLMLIHPNPLASVADLQTLEGRVREYFPDAALARDGMIVDVN
ncbi:MAG: MBL fold metallo-hydrolase [Planctomycetota bacterium]